MLNLIVSNSVILLQSRIFSRVCMLYYITISTKDMVYCVQLAKTSVSNQVQVRLLGPTVIENKRYGIFAIT